MKHESLANGHESLRALEGYNDDPRLPTAPTYEGAEHGALDARPAPKSRRVSDRIKSVKGHSILLVEDSDSDALLLTEYLTEVRMTVHHVCSVRDAELALRDRRFDFVISDLMLPDGCGLDSVHHLAPLAGDAPLIILSGINDEDLALHAIQQGAQDYLVKGEVDAAMIRRTLRHASERKQVFNRLLHLTRHDALTGAVNRLALREHIDAAIAAARGDDRPFVVLYIDIDHFKAINDTLGHDVGDLVLCEVTTRLQQTMRPHDVVARLGGDEFAVLVHDLDDDTAPLQLAERLLRGLEHPIVIDGRTVVVTASIGIACFPAIATSADELLKAADTAMYQAKRSGRNNARISSAASDEQQARDRLATELQHALERGEFLLHFQPLLTVTDKQLVAFEALLRWNRPGGAIVPPSVFIPLLEENGRMVAVGEWVIERACQQLASWHRAGRHHLRIAVNLSARQFDRAGLVEWVAECLERFALPAQALELEITESQLMSDLDRTIATLAELRSLGVRVAIDDFGTGFSSLAYLSQFSIDCLKIDRSFIEQVHAGGEHAQITLAIIALGHTLGLDVVAEGVETAAQLEFLCDSRCDLMQGYLLGHPDVAASFRDGRLWPASAEDSNVTSRIRPVRDTK